MAYMSTKITLSHNDFIHVYNECFDDFNVYVNFDISDDRFGSFKIKLDAPTVMVMYAGLRKHVAMIMENGMTTDGEIKDKVEKQVTKRLNKSNLYAAMSSMPYGSVTDPVDQQKSRGIDYFTDSRNKYKNHIEKAISSIDDAESVRNLMNTKIRHDSALPSETARDLSDMLCRLAMTANKESNKEILLELLSMTIDFLAIKIKAKDIDENNIADSMLRSINKKLDCHALDNTPSLFSGDII